MTKLNQLALVGYADFFSACFPRTHSAGANSQNFGKFKLH